MSAIVDDTVENGFMKAMAAAIEAEPDNKSLEFTNPDQVMLIY